jgi:tetratricopeptide (TPR) repeat protein
MFLKKVSLLVLVIINSLPGFSFYNGSNQDSAVYYLKKARLAIKDSKILEADNNFRMAIQFADEDPNARIEYGNYLVAQRKFFPAIEQFGKILEGDINHLVALQKMTEISFSLRRWNDVIIYGNKLLEKSEGSNVKYMLGKSFYEVENYGQSKKFLAETLAGDPKQLVAVTLLGKVLIELSDYKQAVAVYNKTLQLDPNNKQLIYELGLLYYTMNNYPEAVKYFELAAEKGYQTDLGYTENLGLAYLSFDLDKGVEILNKVLESKPGNTEILFQVAQAYFQGEKFEDAALTYQRIYEGDPSNSRALFMTGVAYQKKGDKNKGVAYCEQAIRMDPTLAQYKSAQPSF